MRRRSAHSLVIAVALALLGLTPSPAFAARAKVVWTDVVVPEGEGSARTASVLTELLKQASRKASWAKGSAPLRLSSRVTRLEWTNHGDVVRLAVTIVARIEGGPSARSHIRVGGKPSERDKLVREALSVLSVGLVNRLAALSHK